jgi:hypothetical protein
VGWAPGLTEREHTDRELGLIKAKWCPECRDYYIGVCPEHDVAEAQAPHRWFYCQEEWLLDLTS